MDGRHRRLPFPPHRRKVIVVDSSIWGDFFNGADTAHVDRLQAALKSEEDLAVLPIIVAEVLQGFRSDAAFRTARGVLTALPRIARVCLDLNAVLLTPDADFERIAAHTRLRLWRPSL